MLEYVVNKRRVLVQLIRELLRLICEALDLDEARWVACLFVPQGQHYCSLSKNYLKEKLK